MNRILFLMPFMLGIVLCACSLAPEYTRPAAPVPENWPTGKAYRDVQTAAATDVELQWKECFTDIRLQQIIETALKNNRDLRIAALNARKVRALCGIQRAELFPTINTTGGMVKERIPADLSSSGKSMTAEQYSVSLGIASWEIDFFGRIRSLEDRALQEYLATEQARRSVHISLISGIVNAYLTLAADRANLQLARFTLEAQQASYTLIRKRFEAGFATELDLRRAQTQVDTARGNVARYTQLTALDRNALDLLIGAPVSEELLPADLNSVTSPKDISPGLSSEVLLNRPDIMAAEHRLKGAYAYIGAARAAFFPRISLTSSIGTASAELSDLFGAGSATWSFVPRISIPIFDARTWAALRVSKADREIILTQYEKTIQVAFREVADALAIRGTVDQRLAAQQSLVDAVSETYRLSNKRYTMGVDSYLGVLDAQRMLYAAQEGLIALQLARLVNRVALYNVLGGSREQ